MTVIAAVTNGNYTHRLDVTLLSQNISANTSSVSYAYTITRNVASGSGAFAGSPGRSFTATINGTAHSVTSTFDFRTASPITFVSGTQTIAHNTDGTKTISGSFNGPATFVSSGFPETSGSGSLTLPTIPRASLSTFSVSGTDVTSIDAGSAVEIDTNRTSSSFTHEIDYAFGTANGVIATGVGVSTSWTPPLTLLNQIPNGTSGTVTITTKTYDASSNLIGTRNSNLTLTAGSGIVPTIGSVTQSEATTSPAVASLIGGYVQGVSTLAVAINSAAGVYGSTIVSSVITVADQTINASSGTTNPITTSGTVAVTGTVTDSRGRVTSTTNNITVLAYASPTVTTATAKRALSGGTPDPNGTYMLINVIAAVQSLVVGSQKNDLTFAVKKQARGGSTAWSTITPDYTHDAHSTGYSGTNVIGTYLVADSYDVRIEVSDVLGTITAVQSTFPTGGVLMHWSNTADGIGVGKYWEKGSIDAQDQLWQNNGQKVVDESMVSTTSDVGVVELAADSDAVTGTNTTKAITPHALVAGFAALDRGRKNALNNIKFRINQRAYVSATALASGAYGFDRWAATTASTSLTFTAAPQGQSVTISANGSIAQTVERANVVATTWVLSWTGTAKGRVYNVGATAPAYAASGLTVALDGLADVVVEFSTASGVTATLNRPQLEMGTIPTATEHLSFNEDLMNCKRYFVAFAAGEVEVTNPYMNTALTAGVQRLFSRLPVTMRTTPTVTTSAGATVFPFTYLSWTAGSSVSRMVEVTGSTPNMLDGSYQSSDNSATALAIGYATGISTGTIWVSADF